MGAQRILVFVATLVVVIGSLAGAANAEDPVKGGTLVVALDADPGTLNGGINTGLETTTVSPQMLSVLLRMDNNRKLIPELADSWSMAADGLTYTFKLHPNVKWHDGQPFTSEDVKFSLLEIDRKFNTVAVGGLAAIDTIDTPDTNTVVLHLKYAFPPLLEGVLAGANTAVILPKHLYDTGDPLANPYNLKPVGTGPFKFVEWVKGDRIVLEKNPDYFKPGQPYVDKLIFKIIPDPAARVAALEKGDVDVLPYYTVPTLSVPELQQAPGVKVIVDANRPTFAIVHATFNLRNPILAKKEVRQAIANTIDRKLIVQKALGGLGVPATGPISSAEKDLYNPAVKDRYTVDAAKANSLLDAAGYPKKADGSRFNLKVVFQRGAEAGAMDSVAEIAREELRAVGINLDLEPLDAAGWSNAAYVAWQFDISLVSLGTGPDPSIGLQGHYLSTNIRKVQFANNSGYVNPRIDELFAQGAKELDATKRKTIYDEVQTILIEDIPLLTLWEKVAPIAFRETVRGFPSGPFHWENYDAGWIGPVGAVASPSSGPGTSGAPAPGDTGGSLPLLLIGGILAVVIVAFAFNARRSR
jgi:peptide/nickel transport system substrate-binding protein